MVSQSVFDELLDRYRSEGLVLAIGAGVSCRCKLPNWEDLLERLFELHDPTNGPAQYRALRENSYPLPAIASIIEAECKGENYHCIGENIACRDRIGGAAFSCGCEDFGELIRKALYRDFRWYNCIVTAELDEAFTRFVEQENPTMSAIGMLCGHFVPGRKEGTPNPRIHAVINFNLDAILKTYVHGKFKTALLHPVERPSAERRPGRIPEYHMHGYFQFDPRYQGKRDKEATDIKVLTEQEYFDFADKPNSMFSYTFRYLVREHTVLFVGLSMSDENIRRMLHYSKNELRDSFRRETKSEPSRAQFVRHFAILKEIDPRIREMTQMSLERLGTRVLWVNEFEEIPTILARLKELGRAS